MLQLGEYGIDMDDTTINDIYTFIDIFKLKRYLFSALQVESMVHTERATLVGSGAPRSPRSVLQASDSKLEHLITQFS